MAEPSSSLGSGEVADKSTGAREIPLGLGGGLQPKVKYLFLCSPSLFHLLELSLHVAYPERWDILPALICHCFHQRRSQQSKVQPVSGEAGPSSSADQSQQAKIAGQQILQSLASRSTAGNIINPGSGQTGLGVGQSVADTRAIAQGSDGQLDVTGTMSQLLQSPALNGLLSGVAQQTGVGSPDVLRNMLQQFTQNPAMRNTVNQLAQQVDREEFRNMFEGMGTGGDGTLDFSTMFQQMMPVVSQVFGGSSAQNEQLRSMIPELLPQLDGRSLEDNLLGLISQVSHL